MLANVKSNLAGSVIGLAIFGTAFVSYYQWIRNKRLKSLEMKSIGRPAIGGPFTLVDHNGKVVTDNDYRGKYMLIYFGFTFCPDICPAEMEKMARVMKDLETLRRDDMVVPMMITVDPKRDSCKQVGQYVKDFHPGVRI